MPPDRYPSDLTDAQWELIEPVLPGPNTGGRPEKHPRREIVNAILYVVRSGCPWRYLPTDLPPWQTVYWYFQQWEAAGVTETLLRELRIKARRADGRADEPTAGLIDSQSVKGADTVGGDSRGYDAGKKINGRKRFIVTDTTGLLVTVTVLAASWQDRDGAKTALLSAYLTTPIRHVFADQGFAGRLVDWTRDRLRTTLEIVRKPADKPGFNVIARRWVVERTLAWLTACRRLARDYERDPAVSEALIRWAAIAGMARRLTRGGPARRQPRYICP
ncbi:IS5/IS1182 family transposase [Spongiactinospora gelatinilytica]|uniref:IS5/IS1182 family transposase n=1 Tax=Spongiactinospora gelatinilytica TaxID=2666298 RepID=A0A2W2HIS4_9ACTN|nr:IS5 family transposase [Spongiactinospora gelatinilytica]PZG45977.1 IS5/IS1182 family transposase [Spongiactinospora gelatinilytica]